MSRITVQRQNWQRWPRVLIAEKRNDDGTVYERRYVPEGGAHDKWDGEREIVRCRDCESFRAETDHFPAVCLLWGRGAEPNGFCNRAVRKADG